MVFDTLLSIYSFHISASKTRNTIINEFFFVSLGLLILYFVSGIILDYARLGIMIIFAFFFLEQDINRIILSFQVLLETIA